MNVALHHATPECVGTFGLRGAVNEWVRCDGCGGTYRFVARGECVYVYEVITAELLSQGVLDLGGVA